MSKRENTGTAKLLGDNSPLVSVQAECYRAWGNLMLKWQQPNLCSTQGV